MQAGILPPRMPTGGSSSSDLNSTFEDAVSDRRIISNEIRRLRVKSSGLAGVIAASRSCFSMQPGSTNRRGTEMSLQSPQIQDQHRFWQRIAFLALGVAVSLFSVVLVSGCAGLPADDARAQLKPATQYAAERSFSGQTGQKAQWPADAWWTAYGDAQLDRLIDEALAGAPNIAVAEARLRRAQALAGIAQAAKLPQVSANGSISEQKQSRNYLSPRNATPEGWNDYGRATLDFSWELDFWGKNRAALAAATSEVDASAADVAQARLVLSSSIASAYAELARLHAALDTANAALEVRAKTAALFRQRYANGLETLGSVRQVESRRAAAQADVLSLEEQLGLQRNRIAALMRS